MRHSDISEHEATLASGLVYRHPPLRQQGRARAVETYWQTYSERFSTKADMIAYLDALTLPASGAWVYGRIPKTGTHSVLAALFSLEFGANVTTSVDDPRNASSDMAPHLLDEAGLFMTPLQARHAPDVIKDALRFTVLRNPVDRALSSFRYLCKSHTLSSRQLAPTRLRLSAITGFDWEKDVNTGIGLEKMLRFVEDSAELPRFKLDRHIAPQTATFTKDQFNPYMTGRTEELRRFVTLLAEEFGRSAGSIPRFEARNQNNAPKEFVVNHRLRVKIETVFKDDMDWYDSI